MKIVIRQSDERDLRRLQMRYDDDDDDDCEQGRARSREKFPDVVKTNTTSLI